MSTAVKNPKVPYENGIDAKSSLLLSLSHHMTEPSDKTISYALQMDWNNPYLKIQWYAMIEYPKIYKTKQI